MLFDTKCIVLHSLGMGNDLWIVCCLSSIEAKGGFGASLDMCNRELKLPHISGVTS